MLIRIRLALPRQPKHTTVTSGGNVADTTPFDAAALAGATLAAVLAVVPNPGPFTWMDVVIGATLLSIIYAYESRRRRRFFRQSVALGAASAVATLMIVGVLGEFWWGEGDLDGTVRRDALNQEFVDSAVPPWFLPASWIVMTIVFTLLDHFGVQRPLAARESAST